MIIKPWTAGFIPVIFFWVITGFTYYYFDIIDRTHTLYYTYALLMIINENEPGNTLVTIIE